MLKISEKTEKNAKKEELYFQTIFDSGMLCKPVRLHDFHGNQCS